MTKTELESDNFFLSAIPLPLHIKGHNYLIIGLPVAPQLWNGLSPSKKDKMVDGSTRGPCVFHSPVNRVDFCREGTGHFRSSGEQIWKSIWNEHRIILRRVIRPISTPNDRRNTVFYNVISLSGSCRNNALPRSHGKTSTCCNSLPVYM